MITFERKLFRVWMLQWVNSLSYFRLFFFLCLLIYSVFIFSPSLNLFLTLPSLSLFIQQGWFSLKNTPAVFHVALFTLCLQFAFHILQPRPRRYAGLRDKSHTQKKGEKNGERRKGQPFTAMQLSQHLMPAAAAAGFCSVASALLALYFTSAPNSHGSSDFYGTRH